MTKTVSLKDFDVLVNAVCDVVERTDYSKFTDKDKHYFVTVLEYESEFKLEHIKLMAELCLYLNRNEVVQAKLKKVVPDSLETFFDFTDYEIILDCWHKA